MAAAPDKGLRFEINGLKFVYGIVNGGDFGLILCLAKENGVGSNNYAWVSQWQLDDLTANGKVPTDAEIDTFCQSSLAEVNRILARDFPVGGVTNPVTPKEKVDAFVMGLMFDSTTNQIKRK